LTAFQNPYQDNTGKIHHAALMFNAFLPRRLWRVGAGQPRPAHFPLDFAPRLA